MDESTIERFKKYESALLDYNTRDGLWTAAGIREHIQSFDGESPVPKRLADAVEKMFSVVDLIGLRKNPPPPATDQGSKWLRLVKDAPIYLAEGPFRTDEWTDSLTDDLARAIEYADCEVTRRETKSYEFFAGGYEYTPAIAAFPVFLLSERRRNWEVFRYGRQIKLTLVMSRSLDGSLFSDLNTTGARPILEKIAREKRLHLRYFGVGHAAFRIALGELEPPEYCWFRDRASVCNVPDCGVMDDADVQALADSIRNDEQVLVTDPGEQFLYQLQSKHHELRYKEIDHGIDIPVGLGFSVLTTAKFLLKPKLAQQIARVVYAKVLSGKLKSAGINVEPRYLTELKALAELADSPTLKEAREKFITNLEQLSMQLSTNTAKAHEYASDIRTLKTSAGACRNVKLLDVLSAICKHPEAAERRLRAIQSQLPEEE